MAGSVETQTLKGPGLASALAATVAFFFPGGQVAGVAAFSAFMTTFATSYALQAWSMREARKRSLEDVMERKTTIRSAVTPMRVVYGEAMVSGPMIYAQVTGTDKEYLHVVLALAGHTVQGFGEVYFDDVKVGALDGSGNVTTGEFAGLARIQFSIGAGTAYPDLVTESAGKWTTNHKGSGIASLYCRLKWDQDKFPGGIPQIRVLVRGAKCLDTRDSVVRYTHNPALILRDYLTAPRGLNCSTSEIDVSSVTAAANVCDGWVALATGTSISVTADPASDTFATAAVESRIQTGDRCVLTATGAPTGLTAGNTYYIIRTGPTTFQLAADYSFAIEGTPLGFSSAGSGVSFTSIEQRRYTACGTFTRDMAPKDVIDELLRAMAGSLVWTGGKWRMTAGAYTASTFSLTASHLRGPVTFRNRVARHQLTNQVRGAYVEPARSWVVTDYPPITAAAFQTEDGEQIERSIDQPWVTNAFRAQRLGKISLLKSRAKRLRMPCKISALPILATDTVQVTLPQLGLSAAEYRVVGWSLTGEDGALGVDLELEEEAAAHYDWDPADGVAPPINTSPELPSQLTVAPPGTLTLSSGTSELLLAGDGTIISRIRVSWVAAAEPNILGYEVQWKASSESSYNSMQLPRDGLQVYVSPVSDGVNYNVRVRTLAAPARRSSWVTGVHTVVGKTAAPVAPTSLGITAIPNALQISWSASAEADYAETEVWEASANDRSGATLVASLKGNALQRSGFSGGTVRYYWVRHVDTSGNVSAWYPASATGGVSGTAGADPGNQITHDFTGFVAGGATGYLSGSGYWLGYASGSYRFHLGNPSGYHIRWDGTSFVVAGALLAGELQVHTTGNVRGGQTAYNTGTGFFLGYDGAAYKLSIGNPSGSRMTWDGSALTVANGVIDVGTGSVKGGQTAYNTGTGFFLGNDGGTPKFSIGNPAGQYLRWTGSALEVYGQVIDTRPFAAGTTPVASASTTVFMPGAAGVWARAKAITVPRAGIIRCTWDGEAATTGSNTKTRIYKNGVAQSAEYVQTALGWASHSYDLSVAAGDTVELYAWWQIAQGRVRNFVLRNSFNESFFVVVQDT